MAKKKKKKSNSTRFTAEATIENVALTRAKSSITLEVFDRGEKLGELQIGRGSMFWWGAKRQKGKRLWWGQVATAFNKIAYPDE